MIWFFLINISLFCMRLRILFPDFIDFKMSTSFQQLCNPSFSLFFSSINFPFFAMSFFVYNFSLFKSIYLFSSSYHLHLHAFWKETFHNLSISRIIINAKNVFECTFWKPYVNGNFRKLSVGIELFLDQIISCGCSINAVVRCVFFSILVQKQIINFPYEFNQPIFCNASIVFQAISVTANSNVVLLNSNQSGEEKQNVSFSVKYCFFSVPNWFSMK